MRVLQKVSYFVKKLKLAKKYIRRKSFQNSIQMTKKAQKSQSARIRKLRNENSISFNNFSFTFGNLIILTDELSKETRQMMIEYYKNKQFDKQLYQKKLQCNSLDRKKVYMVLMESQGREIIREIEMKGEVNMLRQLMKKQEAILEKMNVWLNGDILLQNRNDLSGIKISLHRLVREAISQGDREKQQMENQKQTNKNKLRQITQRTCLKIQQQIFIESIVMIIERRRQKEDQAQSGRVMVIFEQCYSCREFDRIELMTMIGKEAYERKILAALKIFHYSITEENFYNPQFIVCHDCMKVIAKLKFPEQDLKCCRTLNQWDHKHITSKFTLTPFSYIKKVIQKHHFHQDQQTFIHPYIQYFSKGKNQGYLACNRYWCGLCVIQFKRHMDFKHCQFCDLVCNCKRCNKFFKLVKLLGHYLHLGGKYDEISTKFLFTRVFNNKHFNSQTNQNDLNVSKMKKFPFKQDLRAMYYQYVKHQRINLTSQWISLANSQIISGCNPQNQAQIELIKEWWSNDKMRVKKSLNYDQINLQKLKIRKRTVQKRQQNIEAKIATLSQQTKNRLINAELQQRKILKNELIKAGVIKLSNPVENYSINNKNTTAIIVQKSELNKNQNKFVKSVSVSICNHFRKTDISKSIFGLRSQQGFDKKRTLMYLKKQSKDERQDYEKSSNFSNEKEKLPLKNDTQAQQKQSPFKSI